MFFGACGLLFISDMKWRYNFYENRGVEKMVRFFCCSVPAIYIYIYMHLYTTQKNLKEHFDIMIFIERYPLKRCQGCIKLIASKVNFF